MLLKYKTPMMNGPEVKRVQEDLDELGYSLGKYGPDSWYGKSTAAAVAAFQTAAGLKPDSIVGPKTWAKLDEIMAGDENRLKEENDNIIIDIMDKYPNPRLYSRSRSPNQHINTVVLHQMGVYVTDTAHRVRSLNGHIALLQSGDVVLVNSPKDYIWHAQELSDAISIEVNGLFAGIPTKSAPQILSDNMIEGATLIKNWLVDWFAKEGLEWKYLCAHRQSKNSRRADPGYEIWNHIALPWIEEMGLSDKGPDWCIGSGKPIPKEWNPSYSGRY